MKGRKLPLIENSVLKELLELINEEIVILERKRSIELERYEEDVETQHIVERAFTNAIQACIDIGARIIAKYNLGSADDYHSIFDVLYRERIISKELCRKMHEMVGLRNALTHEYRRIKDEKVYFHLHNSLGVFKEFAKSVARYLMRKRRDKL